MQNSIYFFYKYNYSGRQNSYEYQNYSNNKYEYYKD